MAETVSEIRAQAFEDAAKEMDRLVNVMRDEHERVKRLGIPDWTLGHIADREGHAVWLRRWAKAERNKEVPNKKIHDVDCACRNCFSSGRDSMNALQEIIDRLNSMEGGDA